MRHKWTTEDKEYIKDHAATLKDKDMADVLSKLHGVVINRQSVAYQRTKLDVKKTPGRGLCRLRTETKDGSGPF